MTHKEKIEHVKDKLKTIKVFFISESANSNMQNRGQIVCLINELLNILNC